MLKYQILQSCSERTVEVECNDKDWKKDRRGTEDWVASTFSRNIGRSSRTPGYHRGKGDRSHGSRISHQLVAKVFVQAILDSSERIDGSVRLINDLLLISDLKARLQTLKAFLNDL
jgi:hypothetical protein